ncbi:hypothetical protein C8R41DRAFT_916226 [Lentinula lateritia]|uniref:Uncharacterized protein n=1 Tax=Lentinula lateritia TaxID=40482 RepID=A0ABQ8VTD0_9AGAR|nr:hypothetical protein C8R41DRAFT_916226 [Lentinula lateritia]
MASTSSQTRASASSTRLPCSVMEAQVLLAGLSFKSTLPLFFESAVFQRLQQGDYSPPVIDSTNSPDYNDPSSLPAFSYPRSLVPFCFPPESLLPLSVASGLDLFCSAQMAVQTLQVLTDDSPLTELSEVYDVFEEAAPFLIYIHDFWIGRANCPLFAEHVLATATFLSQGLPVFLRDNLEQQWGIPPDHRSQVLDSSKFERFPAIPIPFCLRFREGSAMMCLVPPKDLDPFISIRLSTKGPRPRNLSPVEDSPSPSGDHHSVGPPKQNKRKRELASLMADASSILDRRSATKTPRKEDLSNTPKASSSKKKVEKPLPKPKATARSKTPVKVVEESRVSPESEESATPSYQIKRVRLPPRLRQAAKGKARQMEVLDVKESETEEEVVPPPSKRLKSSKSTPASSKASIFRPALLVDEQGRLKLPGDLVEGFTPFKRIEHARNSAPLQRQNPIFDVNPEFLDLGVILTTQKASFTMQDLLQINRTIRDPAIPAQACVSALSRGEFNSNSSRLPGLKYVDLAMDALNALHVATTSSTLNLTNSLRRTQELRTQLDRLGALFDQARQSFLQSFRDLQQAGQDPIVVLEALKAAEPQRKSLSVEDWTVLATLFQWSSPFNLNGLNFDNRTPAEWIDLLRSLHSGAAFVTVTADGHLVAASQPPAAAVEVSEALDPQGSPPSTVVEQTSGVENLTSLSEGSPIQTELDLPQIESLTESTLAPEKGI